MLECAFQRQELFGDEFMCLAHADHPSVKYRLTFKQYVDNTHVLFTPPGRGERLLDEALKKQRIKRQIALRVSYIHNIPYILSRTPHIVTILAKFAATLHRSIVDSDAAHSDAIYLRLHAPPVTLLALRVMQYWHRAAHRDPAHPWLRRVIRNITPGCSKICSENDSKRRFLYQ